MTGIELGSESCVVARLHRAGDATHVFAVYGLEAGDARPGDADFVPRLAAVRRARRLPRRARVVAWRVGETPSAADPAVRLAIGPLVQAGFVIQAVLSPPQALGVLGRGRSRGTPGVADVYAAINRDGAAIAALADGRLVYSRLLEWPARRPPVTRREELLNRYLLVAHLAPELQHAFQVVHDRHGLETGAVVTCGDFPDLRSLTMPLIEELDRDVETLDSFEGLSLAPAASSVVGENAAPLRLASAAAVLEEVAQASRRAPLFAAAAAAGVVAAVVWGGFRSGWFSGGDRVPAGGAPRPAVGESRPRVTSQEPRQAEGGRPAPASTAGRETPPVPAGSSTGPPSSPPVPEGLSRNRDARPSSPAVQGRSRSPGLREPARAQRPDEAGPPTAEPLPAVNSILASPERRLAVLNGEIVREGDAFGRRVVVRIDPDGVVLREPSGREVRVSIRRTVVR